ncbi:MAG: hypothetical protein K2M93_08890 [Muribaculaceae bacterium]|nr:hypothetical protein [Muribaculaceae bacterium]
MKRSVRGSGDYASGSCTDFSGMAVTPTLRDGGLFAATECLRYYAEVGKPPLLRLLTNGLCGRDISHPYLKI